MTLHDGSGWSTQQSVPAQRNSVLQAGYFVSPASSPTAIHSEQCETESINPVQNQGVLNVMKRDRFELLSAYLDGELSAEDRHQVEQWLEQDPVVQRLYRRLLRLRQGLQSLPTPSSEQSVEETVDQVIARLKQVPRRMVLWGGGAAAALFVSVLMGAGQPDAPTMAQSDQGLDEASTEVAIADGALPEMALQIAIDQPVIEIPKAAATTSEF